MSTRNLIKALKTQKSKTQQTIVEIYGTLGIPLNGQKLVDVPERSNYVYVRLRDNQNEVVQAFNNTVATSYDLPVIVNREGDRYTVMGLNTARYQNTWNVVAPYLPNHGNSHSFSDSGGGDVSWIFSRQFMPNLVYPSSVFSGTNLQIAGCNLYNQGVWKYVGNTGTPSPLPYLPTGSSIMALLYMDATTGNPGWIVGSGSYFSSLITGSADVVPYIPALTDASRQIPLAGVRLTPMSTGSISWDNIYDARQWLHATPSGTSSGGSGGGGVDTIGFAGLSNGVPIGTGTFLNVQGATFTRSGTMFNLNIPTSSSYDNFWNSGTAGAYSLKTKNDTTTDALGDYAVAEGQDTTAQANYSHAEGRRTLALGTGSHAEGYLTTAYGNHSHAEGYQTYVSGTTSFVSGNGNHNIGNYSAVIGGLNNRLTGNRSVMLGGFSRTGTADDTAYTPKLNIQTVQAGLPLVMLGVDNQGMVVSGTFPAPQMGIYGISGTTGVATGTTLVVRNYLGLSSTGTFLYLNPSIGTGTFQLASGDRGVTNGDLHNHVGGDGAAIYTETILFAHGNSATIPASTTYYLATPFTTLSTTAIAAFIPTVGTIQNFYLRTAGAQPASGALVCTVTINGVDSALTFTVPAGGAAGTYSDTTHSASVSAGDRVGFKLVNNATGASAGIGAMALGLKIANS